MMQFLLFGVGERRFAYPLDHIQELVKSQDYRVSVVPGSDPLVCGITYIRDELVTVLDAHAILGEPQGSRSFFLIVDSMAGKYALWIDAIDQIIASDESELQQVCGRSVVVMNDRPIPIVGFRDNMDQLFARLAG